MSPVRAALPRNQREIKAFTVCPSTLSSARSVPPALARTPTAPIRHDVGDVD